MTMSSETASEGHGDASVSKRDFLFLTTGSLAAVAVATTIWPFIDQMNPDAATIAAAGPVDIDISQLQPGQRVVTLWAARPVFVVKRAQPALDELKNPKLLAQLRDPNSQELQQPAYAANWSRSIKPENSGRWSASALTLAAFRCSTRSPMRPTPRLIGQAASFARATARNTIWRAGCSRAFPRPTTSRFRLTFSRTIKRCGSARTRPARISISTRSCRSS